ncbi:MAG: (d)CMP kinase [Chloroflexi bacterium]|jgi:cytidylate kinase|nr:(d)CMP kinase [Chloroflexota bacterium]HOE34624.1 (d)CMP kinase [Anaerolineaceae bacterium]HOT24852.1 (d)CMP kinase [Anaerolineaceae bacterium]HQH57621.1 (d)CMP kinase [Anaerolineaceae bacterium]HQK03179.1 (d)CMP kinase [Anaerolineaceae bacterium]
MQTTEFSTRVPQTIAIDGPAASGKTTVGAELANRLGYLCLDTGIMYRAITWQALSEGLNPEDEAAISRLAESIEIDVRPKSAEDGRAFDVLINHQDHTWDIRKPEVNQHVSLISSYPGVRSAMTLQQRKIAARGKIVMLGRDIGSVVLPDADLKIYLDASLKVRARRRYEEEKARGNVVTYQSVVASLRRRDKIDSSRKFAPLKIADDAVVINTDALSAEQVVEKILALISARESPGE